MFRFISYLVVFFDAGQGDCGVRKGIGVSAAGSLLFFLSTNTARHLLLFVLVSAAIDDKSGFRFKWLWL
jgi:hypothetical protein